MRADHLVPHHFGYTQVGCLFGESSKGYDHVWSVGNGLHLDKHVEEAFDKGGMIIVPYDKLNDGQRRRLQVVDRSLCENPWDGEFWRTPPQHRAGFRWGDGTARAQILIRSLYNHSPAHVQDKEARLATYGGGAEAKVSLGQMVPEIYLEAFGLLCGG